MFTANQNLKHKYAGIPSFGAAFIAEQRDTLDVQEMRCAQIANSAEPQTHVAYRRILQAHGWVRGQLNEIRRARHAQSKPLSARGLAIVNHFEKSGWRVSRPFWDRYEAEQMQLVTENLAYLKACWTALRREEQAETDVALLDAVFAFAAE